MASVVVEFCDCDDCYNNTQFDAVAVYEIKKGENLKLLPIDIKIGSDYEGTHICEYCLDGLHDEFPNLLIECDEPLWDLIINPIISEDESLHADLMGDDYERQVEIYKLCEVYDDGDN